MRCVLLIGFVLAAVTGSAQRKMNFPSGSSLIKLFLRGGGQYTGILLDADDAGVQVAKLTNLDEVSRFAPEEIQRVEIRKVNSVRRNTAIGAGVGFIMGFAIGWEEYKTGSGADINQWGHATGGGLLGAFSGGFIGFLTGLATKQYHVLGSKERYLTILPQLNRYKPALRHEE